MMTPDQLERIRTANSGPHRCETIDRLLDEILELKVSRVVGGVIQTSFGATAGNCHQAAWATLLGLPISDVPNVSVDTPKGHDWQVVENEWLRTLGLASLYIDLREDGSLPRINGLPDRTPCLVGGKSPRGDFGHTVVGAYRREGGSHKLECGKHWLEWVHDPHPDGTWLAKAEDVTFVLVSDFTKLTHMVEQAAKAAGVN